MKEAVLSSCFIFPIDAIHEGLFTCKGMERFYFVRFHRTQNGKLLPVSEQNWSPFHRDTKYPDVESFPEALWSNLVTLKQEVQRAMCRGGQWNGRTVTAKVVGAQPSFFRYLKDELEGYLGDEVPSSLVRYTRSRKVIYDNLCCTRRKIKFKGELVRLLMENELVALRKVFGVTFGVGVMQSVPSVKALKENPRLSSNVWLRNSDPVRIVSCRSDYNDVDQSVSKPSYEGSMQSNTTKQAKR